MTVNRILVLTGSKIRFRAQKQEGTTGDALQKTFTEFSYISFLKSSPNELIYSSS